MDIKELKKEIEKLKYFFDVKIIGRSVFGNEIYALNKVYNPSYKWAIITACIHAREHITTDLIVLFMKKLTKMKEQKCNISFVPQINPDGVELVVNGLNNVSKKYKKKLLKINGGDDFKLFKSNANGVDLNNNWNACWEQKFTTKTKPSSQGYYGEKCMSEPEVIALEKWSKSLDLFLSLSYHTKGEEIYFDFFQKEGDKKRDFTIAKVFSSSTGYKIKSTQDISSGGFKDWCVCELHIPALTIEVGDDSLSHPISKSHLMEIYKKNKNIFFDIEKSLAVYKSCCDQNTI